MQKLSCFNGCWSHERTHSIVYVSCERQTASSGHMEVVVSVVIFFFFNLQVFIVSPKTLIRRERRESIASDHYIRLVKATNTFFRGSQWGDGFYDQRLKFWPFYG